MRRREHTHTPERSGLKHEHLVGLITVQNRTDEEQLDDGLIEVNTFLQPLHNLVSEPLFGKHSD